ncbi:MAG: precorrin-2 C(20)-methyltransferase [Firmicutes bacterium]|nr:precorrin-2 C(20)-methyltransferase [Bacillota bacterium]
MTNGIIYGIGVGPGDPELMTLKAIKLIREADVIVVPGKEAKQSVAYKIAAGAVPEIAQKELLAIPMPMTKDRKVLAEAHRKGADMLEEQLNQGKTVVFLTLGDPTVYCTFSYLQHHLEADGYKVELVPGISSIMACAAKLGIPLAEWDEPVHIIPGALTEDIMLDSRGTYVLMKSASRMKDVKDDLRISGRSVQAVLNCGMENERICRDLDEIPDDAGYFALVIAKEN